jgi:serine/threonine-protein kinase
VGLAGAALAGILALTRGGAGRPPGAVVATTASAIVPPATTAPAVTPSATAEATHRALLFVRPGDATAEVDGAPVAPDGGVLAIEGPLGSIHRVRLHKGKSEVESEVAITASGAMPAKLELPAAPLERGPTKETPAAKSSAAPAPTPATTTGKVRTAFE